MNSNVTCLLNLTECGMSSKTGDILLTSNGYFKPTGLCTILNIVFVSTVFTGIDILIYGVLIFAPSIVIGICISFFL